MIHFVTADTEIASICIRSFPFIWSSQSVVFALSPVQPDNVRELFAYCNVQEQNLTHVRIMYLDLKTLLWHTLLIILATWLLPGCYKIQQAALEYQPVSQTVALMPMAPRLLLSDEPAALSDRHAPEEIPSPWWSGSVPVTHASRASRGLPWTVWWHITGSWAEDPVCTSLRRRKLKGCMQTRSVSQEKHPKPNNCPILVSTNAEGLGKELSEIALIYNWGSANGSAQPLSHMPLPDTR
jgi:hypothetical protein